MFYLGTWKIGDLEESQMDSLFEYAINHGVLAFDTAIVYGGGKVEKALGKLQQHELKIITKIPAKSKPELADTVDIESLYPFDYVESQIKDSLERLRTNRVHALLLHNWCYSWETTYAKQSIELLKYIKNLGIADLVGVSLPNQYNGNILNSSVIDYVDILECPYNLEETFIQGNISTIKNHVKEVVLRSFLKNTVPENISKTLNKSIEFCLANGLSFTIGSTNSDHLKDNIELISNLSRNEYRV